VTAGRSPLARLAAILYMAALYAFLFAPLLVVAGASLGAGDRPYVAFPPESLSLEWYRRISPRTAEALLTSVALACATAAAAVLLALPAALGLVRDRFPGKRLVALLLRAPLQIPFVVTGIAFLQLYYVISGAFGLSLRGSFAGLLLGHLFLATPYAIGAIAAVLQRQNLRLEEAARILGASRWRTFRRVTLPLAMPGVYTGALYAFIVSFGEVPVALFLGGPGATTFPVELFSSMQFDFNPSILAVSTLTLILSIAVLVLLQRLVGLDALLRAGAGRG